MLAINRTDLPIALEGEGVEVRATEAGELTAAGSAWRRGSTSVRRWSGCPATRMRTADGDREYRAGEAFYWAPGHAPEALEDCEYVDFSPTRELSKVVEHIQGAGS
jgi:hypothetical protein